MSADGTANSFRYTTGTLSTSVLVSFNSAITPQGSGKNTFAGPFLGFSKGAYASATRTFSGTSRVTGADFYRLNLDTDGSPWFVFFTAASDTFSVEVPPVPMGVTGDRSENMDLQAFRFLAGGSNPSTLSALVAGIPKPKGCI